MLKNKNNVNSDQTNSTSNNKTPNNANANNTNNQKDRRPRPAYPQCDTCGKTNHSTQKCHFGANAANRPPPRNRRQEGQNQFQQRNAQSNSDGNVQAAAQTLNKKRHVFTPELQVTDRRQRNYQNFHQFPGLSGCNPWRQLQIQCNLNNTDNDSTIYYTQESSKTTVASQTLPPKGTQPQNYVVATQHPQGNQQGTNQYRSLSAPRTVTHGLIHFPHLTMQNKTASSETTTKPQSVITEDALTIPPPTTKTITAFVDLPSKWNTTGTVTPLEKFTETASLTKFDKGIAIRVTNTTESAYLFKKHT